MNKKNIKFYKKEFNQLVQNYWHSFNELKKDRDNILKEFSERVDKRKIELLKEGIK